MIKVFAVCGMGLGTSVVLKSRLRKALDEAGVDHRIEVTDPDTASSQPADLVFTSAEFADRVRHETASVHVIRDFTDRAEIRRTVDEALRGLDLDEA